MARFAVFVCIAFSSLGGVDAATKLGERAESAANPIRTVVNMLAGMQKKITEEHGKREKLFDQYMCYCKNADSTLGASIAAASTKIPQLEASIKESAAAKKQFEAELKSAQVDRVEAKDAITGHSYPRKGSRCLR